MNLLLDTHVLLWWLSDDPVLGDAGRSAIGDEKNVVFVSAANVWEIVIKRALGKLEIPDSFEKVLDGEAFHRLDITVDHAFRVASLPGHHRDPFDRLLIAQALTEGLTLVTSDSDVKKYDVPLLAV